MLLAQIAFLEEKIVLMGQAVAVHGVGVQTVQSPSEATEDDAVPVTPDAAVYESQGGNCAGTCKDFMVKAEAQ